MSFNYINIGQLVRNKLSVWRMLPLFLLVAIFISQEALAQNQIRSISASQAGGADVVRVEFSQPVKDVPKGFVVQNPPRVAIDLPGVANSMGKGVVEFGLGNLRTATVAQNDERTRLVLSLRQAASYRSVLEGNTLLLIFDATEVAGASSEASLPGVTGAKWKPIQDIDFRKGQDGAGRVIVGLPSSQVGVDIQQQGQKLVMEFSRVLLPANLKRRMDVSDFGSPVQSLSVSQVGEKVRIVVEPKGSWEHSAYQSDSQFVLEVRPQKVDPNKLVQGPGFSGEKLSLNFQSIEVRALLQVIADFTKFNVVTSDTVTGSITLRLKDVPWDQALDIIMQAKGLGLRKAGNVLWIAPKDEINAKEKADLEAKAQIAQIEPLRTQAIQLNYTKAEEVAKGLVGNVEGTSGNGHHATRLLSPRGSVVFEARTNQLFITDTPSKLEEISAMVGKFDIPIRQVLIEARIVEADDKFGRSLGVKLGGSDMRGLRSGIPGYGVGGGNYLTLGGNYNAVGGQTLQMKPEDMKYNDTQFVNLPAAALGAVAPANLALTLFSASANRFLNLELSALEADGKGKIVSSPRIIATDQAKSEIEQGEEIPYQQSTSSGATSISFKKASMRLEVTPQITPEGNIILDVFITKDSRGDLTPAGPAINTKRIKTQVLVENGGTVVIGGIFTQTEGETINKVPFLGDIPVVGNLFKNTVRSMDKTELLVFLTPKVISEKLAVKK
ncbi:type IV pilus secretin PilQ [Roseateles sp. BYS180W]|uniref:Type IV pilus biogenesis and competence protein PilQ n=1 Tax=Roseateles rivi TaxID=3299028 RepID=A0ABW7FRD9_9BURK